MEFILLIIWILASHIGLYGMFQKAGEDGWKALVPVYNKIVWNKLIGRPAWRVILLLVPIVNVFVLAGMLIDLVRSFGKLKFVDSLLAIVATPFFYNYLGWKKEEEYVEPILTAEKAYKEKIQEAKERGNSVQLNRLLSKNPYKKGIAREWGEAFIFAIFAASFIRLLLIEPFVIPTPSMENSLLVGDYLFVSKVHYGLRTPMTPVSAPLLHNRLPLIGGESYTKIVDWGYNRLPAITKIQRNDPTVFNFPEGDTVAFARATGEQDIHYYSLQRSMDQKQIERLYKIVSRPVDKRDNYIKRCVGMPGDSLEVRDGQIFIDGVKSENPSGLQQGYIVTLKPNRSLNPKLLAENGIISVGTVQDIEPGGSGRFIMHMSNEQMERVKQLDEVASVTPHRRNPKGETQLHYFPNAPRQYQWNNDWFGPVYIPKKGDVLDINMKSLPLYDRIIDVYEDNDLAVKNGQILINGEVASTYTVKQNYYWLMGDNRHNSLDSRAWGYVPEDHIVGKPLFIFFSSGESGIRFNRILSSANKE